MLTVCCWLEEKGRNFHQIRLQLGLKFHASVDNSIICLFRHFLCTFPAVKSWGNSAICTSNIWIINHESFVCAVIQCLQSIFFYIILLMLRFGRRSHEKTAVTADINLAERFLWQQNETKGNKIHWLHGVRFFGTLSNRRCTGRFSVGTCAHGQTHWALSHLKHLYLWWSVKELLPILLWASVCVCVFVWPCKMSHASNCNSPEKLFWDLSVDL